MTVTKGSFLLVVALLLGVMLVLTGIGFYLLSKRIIKKGLYIPELHAGDLPGLILLLVAAGVAAFFVIRLVFLQHTDGDDSRFVVNAVDMVRTHRLFLTNPGSGEALPFIRGELCKDATSPWAVYPAFLSILSSMKTSVVFHTVMPVGLYMLTVTSWFLIAGFFYRKKNVLRSAFIVLMLLVTLYGRNSIYASPTFTMTRIWQGKSVVAAFGLPMLLYFLLRLYEEERRWPWYVLILITNLSLCFMSGNGIVCGAVMIAAFAFCYTIAKKDLRILLISGAICIPNAVYYYIFMLLTKGLLR